MVLLLVVLLLLVMLLLLLLFALLLPAAFWPPMMDVMAAASATVKFGSAVIAAAAALTVSARGPGRPIGGLGCANCAASAESDDICNPENFDWLYSTCGGKAKAGAAPPPGSGTWNGAGAGASGRAALSGTALGAPGGPWVRSSVTVGNGAEAEMVAMLDEHGSTVRARKLEFMSPAPSALGMEPDSSMDAAADVVDAIAIAAGGSGWLCVPSYVVIRMDRSSAHRCTCLRTGQPVAIVQR